MNWYEVLNAGKSPHRTIVEKVRVALDACTHDNLEKFEKNRMRAIKRLERMGENLSVEDYRIVKMIANYAELYTCAAIEIEEYLRKNEIQSKTKQELYWIERHNKEIARGIKNSDCLDF